MGPTGSPGASFAELPNFIFTPTNGSTINPSASNFNIINPASGISSLTINLPSVVDGTKMYFKFSENVSSVTWTGSGGDIIKGINNPGAILAGVLIVWIYDAGTTSWL